ncbi:SIMPL domain-containing protein [Lonepinella sp. MS14437]|uniref:SIMPL domain-containing protein n=1 Tax=Lonepinella sp. MS14437 TaxID=3003620 RepID=UPI0036D9EDA2
MIKNKILWLALFALPFMAIANESVVSDSNIVNFSVQAEQEVPADVLQVKLFLQEENANLQTLHQVISDKLNQSINKIKTQSAVVIKHHNRSTNLRYNDKGQKNGWIERVDFVLESQNQAVLSQLVDELSDVLSIENINTTLSPEAREKLEDVLSQQALHKFQQKAELIQTSLSFKHYRIVSLYLQAQNDSGYNQDKMLYAVKMTADQAVPLETGRTKISVQAIGAIQLIE